MGGPKNEGKSVEVYENKRSKKRIPVFLWKLLKSNVVICFCRDVYENARDIVKKCIKKDGVRIDFRMSVEVAEK